MLDGWCVCATEPDADDGTPASYDYTETAGISWCSGRDCLIDEAGECGDTMADILGFGVDGNCALLPTDGSMTDDQIVAESESACDGAAGCAGFTLYANEVCFRENTDSKPVADDSTARCFEKEDYVPPAAWYSFCSPPANHPSQIALLAVNASAVAVSFVTADGGASAAAPVTGQLRSSSSPDNVTEFSGFSTLCE